MRTHLVRKGDIFTTTLRMPRGSRLNYSFMLATKVSGAPDIWRSEVYTTFRRKMRKGVLPHACEHCPKYYGTSDVN
jgi:hypothetical protein